MNPLTTVPPTARKVVYALYAWLGLAAAATEVGYRAAHLGQPTWLTVWIAVLAFLAGPIGGLAVTHTAPAAAPAELVAPLADVPAETVATVPDYAAMSWNALRKAAKDRGLNAGGSKTEVVARLVAADHQSPRAEG